MTLALRYAALSHVGLLRSGNEDSVYAGPRLLAVADGMGGHAAGEVASAVTIATIAALDEDAPGADLLDALRTAAVQANEHLREMMAGDAALDGMGTTLTSLLFTGTRLGLLHIGDSRCYLLRDGQLAQITHDDTFVQSLVDEGRITAEEADSHPQRNMILRALDGREDVEFDLSVREAREGDRYLLCSDGLTGPVGDDTLREALAYADPRAAAERLVELALRGGGPDNITVVVADVVDGAADALPVVAGAAAEHPDPALAHLSSGAAGRAAASTAAVAAAAAAEAPEPAAADTAAAGDDPQPPVRRHRGRRTAVLGLLVLVLLGAGVGSAWAYVHAQWYVGVDGSTVSVYRGVSGSIAGLRLSSLQSRTTVTADELSELDRDRVERGIRAKNPSDARRIVGALASGGCTAVQVAEGGVAGGPSSGGLSSGSPSPGPASCPAGTSGGTPALSPGASPAPTATRSAGPGATPGSPAPSTPPPSSATPTPRTTLSPSAALEAGPRPSASGAAVSAAGSPTPVVTAVPTGSSIPSASVRPTASPTPSPPSGR